MTLPDLPATPTPGAPAPAAPKKMRRGVLIGIIAGGLVLLLGLGAAGFALVNLFLGGGQSASASAVAFPKNTIYWAEGAIEPSNSQLVEAFHFVNEFDALSDAIEDSDLDVDFDDPSSYSDLKQSLWDYFVDGDDSAIDTDLDYEDDIEPWLGSRISVGMLPSDDLDEPSLIVAIEARDTAAGVEAVEQLVDDLDVDADVDVRNGYVVVATGDVDLDDAYDEGTLNQSENFARSSKSAGDWGVASVYVDLGGLYGMINEATTAEYGDVDYWIDEIQENYYSYVDDDAYEDYEDCTAFDSPDNVGNETYEDFECDFYYLYDGEYYEYYDEFSSAWVRDHAEELAEEKADEYKDFAKQQDALVDSLEGTTAFVVARFVDSSFEVSGVVSGVKDLVKTDGNGEEAALPASTIAVLSIAGLAETLDASLTDENLALSSGGLSTFNPYGSPSEPVTRDDVEDWFDDTLGVDFPDDLSDIFGSKIEIVADGDLDFGEFGDSGDVLSLGDVAETGAAIVITTDDADATASAWEDLLDTAEDSAGDDLGIDIEQDGDRVVISAGDYLETVLNPDERLGDSDAFRRAIPQHDTAGSMLYLDLAELTDIVDDLSGDSGMLDFVDGAQALGVSSSVLSDDSYSFVLRLTTEAH